MRGEERGGVRNIVKNKMSRGGRGVKREKGREKVKFIEKGKSVESTRRY